MNRVEVLLVDDSEDDRESISRQLTRLATLNCHVDEAEDGPGCLQKLRTGKQYDCILLDYSLPGQDGIRVLRQIIIQDPHAAVVMITGQGNEDVAVEAMKIGALDYLVKQDINPDQVGRTITSAVRQARLARKLAEQQENLAEFARVLVHDLRAPLRSIRLRSEMLKDTLPPEIAEESGGHLDAMHRAADRLDQMIQSLQRYTETDSEESERGHVPLTALVDTLRTALSSVLDEAGAKVEAEPDLPSVFCDEPQIMQLLQNLITNGIKYNQSAEPVVRVLAEPEPDGVVIRVQDNGIGIDPQHHEHIFEPFKRLHGRGSYSGSGLGLATCRKIAERHRGRIWCTSEPGAGSTFHLYLPAPPTDPRR